MYFFSNSPVKWRLTKVVCSENSQSVMMSCLGEVGRAMKFSVDRDDGQQRGVNAHGRNAVEHKEASKR